MSAPTIAIVVPCYNEEEVLPETVRQLSALMDAMRAEASIGADSRIVFVDDGSKDKTWPMIL